MGQLYGLSQYFYGGIEYYWLHPIFRLLEYRQKKTIIIYHRAKIHNKMIDVESVGDRYLSPINPATYPHLALILLLIGLFFTAWFFVYEVTSTKYTRAIMKELIISIAASTFMGLGTLFMILWVGIYV